MSYTSLPSEEIPAAIVGSVLPSGEDQTGLTDAIRDAHRAYTRLLQEMLGEFGVGVGQWHFLRVLWEEDGITQRQLSHRVGTMEPTTVTALNWLEARDYVRRVRNKKDKRKINIFLTERGRGLRDVMLSRADSVRRRAFDGLAHQDVHRTLMVLRCVIDNLRDRTRDDAWGTLDEAG